MATTAPLVDTRRQATPVRRRRGRRLLRLLPALAPALAILVAGYQRRWMSDDGHIYVRTVRQILVGNGPVFNPGERAEASTGTLWQWLLAAAGLPGWDIATAAVYGGLLLTAAGFALAGLGCLRLYGHLYGHQYGSRYGTSRALPLGALTLLALPPVWDFATSGLETGLATCWLAGAWLLLTTAPTTPWTSVVLGLGPLVRPELGLVSAVFLAAQWLTVRPGPRRTLAGLGAALAAPVAYEVFRAGYYGHLVPLPGVTKEASRSLWARGLGYLADLTGPYLLWLPALFILAALLPARAAGPRTPLIPTLAPVVAGLLCWVYVIKVGGDFMHGRMLLPGLFLLLLPVFLVPATRPWTLAATATAVWAVLCAGLLRTPYEGGFGPDGIADERGVYVQQNADPHPVHHTFAGADGHAAYGESARTAAPLRLLLGPVSVAGGAPTVTGVHNVLGMNGTAVPLSGAALDRIGLAYPLAAHSERRRGGRVGHDKQLPVEWIVADRGAGELPPGADPSKVAAARRALGCPALADLRAAARAPLTPRRFVDNLTGAWTRTTFRFPNDPVAAEGKLCGR
ncbi:hypothetical protein [Streptomyces luteolus]|uniref:Terminal beta-(1->2)-arabinofuranosyltransferase C-terminal domain-containing protein n=1 Tax=Streptomyces luteolus TaxID=3043615 RepID=A0ABT6ST57_9ACTN|nr:hypothetical protein [Streptomyces sp. B-S-A12]MDI3418550.1 hypothetical protein [Streptomyces sp. B-S-A12]